jgi:hypothetical protein
MHKKGARMHTKRHYTDPAPVLPIRAGTLIPVSALKIGDVIRFRDEHYMPGIDRLVKWLSQSYNLDHMARVTVFPPDVTQANIKRSWVKNGKGETVCISLIQNDEYEQRGDNQTYTVKADMLVELCFRQP